MHNRFLNAKILNGSFLQFTSGLRMACQLHIPSTSSAIPSWQWALAE